MSRGVHYAEVCSIVSACDTVMPALYSRLTEIKLEMFALFGVPSGTSHVSLRCLLRILMNLSILKYNNEGFEVFTTVTMKNVVFWDVAQCRSCEINRRFGGTSVGLELY
jgi:hypothetical protein